MARALPPGICLHPLGYRAFVRLFHGSGGLKSKVFPKGTSLLDIRRWREEQRGTPIIRPQTSSGFAADAERYLKAVRGMPTYDWREKDIQAWVAVFGHTQRKLITAADIRAQLAEWRTRYAASTVNHRRTALMHLYTVLDGRSAVNPVRDVPRCQEPEPTARGLSYAVIEGILGEMEDSATKARLSVIAYVGLPHAQLVKLTPADIDIKGRTIYVAGRSKGKGTRGKRIPITEQGAQALASFVAHDAFGKFSTSSMRKAFRLACQKQGPDGCLAKVRPYDLRHSFGSLVYQLSGDIKATQELMLHSSSRMTERYTVAAVAGRLTAATQLVSLTGHTDKNP